MKKNLDISKISYRIKNACLQAKRKKITHKIKMSLIKFLKKINPRNLILKKIFNIISIDKLII